MLAQLFTSDQRSSNERQGDACFPQAHIQKALPPHFYSLVLRKGTSILKILCAGRKTANLEKVLEVAIRRLPEMRHLSYPEQMNRHKLFSIRRKGCGRITEITLRLLEVFGLPITGNYFPVRIEGAEVSPLTLAKPSVRITIQKQILSIGVINPWNYLPSEAVMSTSRDCSMSLLVKEWGEFSKFIQVYHAYFRPSLKPSH